MNNKGISLETNRISLLENCKDVFQDNPKEYQFLVEVLDNKKIRSELEKIVVNNPLFRKFLKKSDEVESKEIYDKEIERSISEDGTKLSAKIAIVEEGNTEVGSGTKTVLESHKMTGLGLFSNSVFPDFQIKEEQSATIPTSILSKSKFNMMGLTSTKSKNLKKKQQIINENANYGSPPNSSSSQDSLPVPSSSQDSLSQTQQIEGSKIWRIVKSWISKFVEKIKECTRIIFKQLKNYLIEYGLLILGVALLYSAGIIVEPTFYFTLFLQTLLSFFR